LVTGLNAKTKDKIEPIDLSNIGLVSLLFKYEIIVIESKMMENGKEEITKKYFGQSNLDLMIIDSIEYSLHNVYKLNVSRIEKDSIYTIKINPISNISSSTYLLEIVIYDKNKNIKDRKIISQYNIYDSDNINSLINKCNDFIIPIIK
jgi:hypothetical protein